MRKALLGTLRVLVPLALGIWLVVWFYQRLDEQQRIDLFSAFGAAHWGWLGLTVLLGWASHLVRAWRWRYLLRPLGHPGALWNAYHATMAGYFINLLLPRAGEASRAVLMGRAEGIPFEKGFGTIMAERTVDMLMLLAITAMTLLLQLDKLDLITERIAGFQVDGAPGNGDGTPWLLWALLLAALALAAAAVVWRRSSAWRMRLRSALNGFLEGLASVLRTPHKGAFLFHTLLIWVLYVAMFRVGFFALESTSEVPLAGVFAGFIAGSVGIILVQGGIGAYPAFVALITSIYMAAPEGGGLIRPDALAMGWLLWGVQTAMIIALGGLSLLLASRAKRRSPP
jgi:uncharacterized membrane protein YbhN (UPF0104 family)